MLERDIAVVMVSYKSHELTIKSLASIEPEIGTAGLRIRVIVIDNASGDIEPIAQVAKLRGWNSWLILIEAPRNGGFSFGNNLGIARAYESGRPDYFYFLNPDTEVRPGAIGRLVAFLESNPNVGIAGSGIENVDGSDWPIAFRFPTALSELISGLEWGLATRLLRRWEVVRIMTRTPEQVDWICGASMLIRTAVVETIGGFDENYFLYFEEIDYCFRAKIAGYPTWYVPSAKIMHIVGQSTKVTERNARPKRLPAYWFESRRRYFVRNLGVSRAVLVDVFALVAHAFGMLKKIALGRTSSAVPHFIRDLWQYSVIRRRNRTAPAVMTINPKSDVHAGSR